MTATMIPDDELLATADIVTVWVATQDAPTDFWSLAEAIARVMRQAEREKITLFRPPDRKARRLAQVRSDRALGVCAHTRASFLGSLKLTAGRRNGDRRSDTRHGSAHPPA